MNLVLGTLAELKAHVLAEALRSGTDYDGALTALGLGVAARFEQQCARKFARVEGDTYECPADVAHVSLPRYPLEEITALALRETLKGGWVDQGDPEDIIENLGEQAGLVYFGTIVAPLPARLRLTYTGGYWIDESGDGTIDNRSAVQRGSVSLAADDESKAVTFGTAFATAPSVICSVVAPSGGTIISSVPSLITTSGFTARLGFPIPATGYTLSWIAAGANEAATGGSLPTGATELPADLHLAWLLQCQLAWQSVDNLGTGLGSSEMRAATVASLQKLNLAPEVTETLRRYVRHVIL